MKENLNYYKSSLYSNCQKLLLILRLTVFFLFFGLINLVAGPAKYVRLITTHGVIKDVLDSRGVKYTLMEKEGYGHESSFWRLSLHDLLPRLF